MSDEIVKVETPVPVEKRPVRKTNYFKTLYDIDVSSKVSDKNGLSYLSWASAWAEVKKKRVQQDKSDRIQKRLF